MLTLKRARELGYDVRKGTPEEGDMPRRWYVERLNPDGSVAERYSAGYDTLREALEQLWAWLSWRDRSLLLC